MTSQFLSPIWKINWLTDPLLSFIAFVQMESWRVTFNLNRDLGHKFEVLTLTYSEGLCQGILAAVLQLEARHPVQRTEQKLLLPADGAELQLAWEDPRTWTKAFWKQLGFLPLPAFGSGFCPASWALTPRCVSVASPCPRHARPLERAGGWRDDRDAQRCQVPQNW